MGEQDRGGTEAARFLLHRRQIMKKKHIIRMAVFALLSIFVLSFINNFLSVPRGKDVSGLYGFHKEPENSIDVALVGPSETYTSFYSPLAYEKFGFTSYALAVGGMRGSCYPSAVREMEESQDPQVYVLELYGFIYKDQKDEPSIRAWIDSMPDSENRNETIREIVDPGQREDYQKKYRKYHGNWMNRIDCMNVFLDKIRMDRKGYSITKNFATETFAAPPNGETMNYAVSGEGMKYLKEFLDFLNSRGIENVLFVRTPEQIQYKDDQSVEEAVKLIREAGYDYLDMYGLQDEIGIDPQTDFYNPFHCNIYGAEKVTAYLGQYLMDHYEINTDHSKEVTAEWEDCASYNDKVIGRLKDAISKGQKSYRFSQRELLGKE